MEIIYTDYIKAIATLRAEFPASPDQSLPPPARAAALFAWTLQELPIGAMPNERLAGDYGLAFADAAFLRRAEAPRPQTNAPTSPGPFDRLSSEFGCRAGFSSAHSSANYQLLLEKGLEGIIADLETAKAKADAETSLYLDAEIVSLRAVVAWAARYAKLGFAACEQVPARPPRNFLEAVQSVWLVHTAIGVGEGCYASLSLGRLDQYLLPFSHGASEEELTVILSDLFLKLNRYGDAACAVNLGGVAPDGKDLFNNMSRLIVKVAKELRLPSPILALRVHPGLAREDFDLLTVPELFGVGQPTYYGELACQQALRRRGVPETDVHKWAVNSCMGLIMPGEEFSDMWGMVFNFSLPLELALNQGRPFRGELPFTLRTVCPKSHPDLASVVRTVLAYAGELLAMLGHRHRQINQDQGQNNPDPYLSSLLTGGTPGRDRLLGGPRYHTVNVDAMALVNAADALVALDALVFRGGRHSLAELVAATQNNFSGQEPLRQELLGCPKFGNGDPAADALARELSQGFADAVDKLSGEGLVYMPSFHTLNSHVREGKAWGAGLDGRLAGEPFAKNVGPTQGRNHNGLTGVLASAAAVGQDRFHGGQALDLHVESNLVAKPEGRRKFQAALLAYFAMGGLQVQVNGVNADDLREAIEKPEKHAGLTVRIGGYSDYFNRLTPDVKREMAERLAAGL